MPTAGPRVNGWQGCCSAGCSFMRRTSPTMPYRSKNSPRACAPSSPPSPMPSPPNPRPESRPISDCKTMSTPSSKRWCAPSPSTTVRPSSPIHRAISTSTYAPAKAATPMTSPPSTNASTLLKPSRPSSPSGRKRSLPPKTSPPTPFGTTPKTPSSKSSSPPKAHPPSGRPSSNPPKASTSSKTPPTRHHPPLPPSISTTTARCSPSP